MLAAAIRDGLRQRLDGWWVKMVEAMRELRLGLSTGPICRRSRDRRRCAIWSDEAMEILDMRGMTDCGLGERAESDAVGPASASGNLR